MLITVKRMGSGRPHSPSRCRITERSAPSTVAEAMSVRAGPAISTTSGSEPPSKSAAATRNSSRLRSDRTAATECSMSSWRSAAESASASRAALERGTRSTSSASSETDSGARSNRSVAYRLLARMRAIRSAADDSSRRRRRYQWVEPRASLTRRNPSRPESGSGASANQPSMTGSRVR